MFFMLKVWEETCQGKKINGYNDIAVLANLIKKRSRNECLTKGGKR